MAKRNFYFYLLTLGLFLVPFFVLAQVSESACGPESRTFRYPEQILYNPKTGYLYVFSDTGWLIVLKENDLSVVRQIKAAVGLGKDFALNSQTNRLYVLDNIANLPPHIKYYDATNLNLLGAIGLENADAGASQRGEFFQIEVDENSNKIYVLDRLAAKLLVIAGTDNKIEKEHSISYAAAFWVNPKTQKVYLRSRAIGGIQELDLKTGKTINILTGPLPWDVGLDLSTNRILVADSSARTLAVIDGRTQKLLKTIDLQILGIPRFVALSEKLNLAVVTGSSNNAVFYDLKTLSLRKNLILPENSQPERAFIDEERKLAYIPSAITNIISLVDLNNFEVVRSVGAGILHDVIFYRHNFLTKEGVITPNGNLYLAHPYSHNISRLTPSGEITFTGGYAKGSPLLNHCAQDDPIFANPTFMAVNADRTKVYVSNRGRFVTVIDAKKDEPIRKIFLNDLPASNIVYHPKLDRIFVGHIASGKVSVIDVKEDKLISQINVGIRATRLIPNAKNGDLYVLSVLSNSLAVIRPDFTTSEIKLDSKPIDVEYDQTSDRLFVTTGDSLVVIDIQTNQIVKTIPDLRNTSINRAGAKILFSNSANNYFIVLDPSTLETKKVNFDNPFSFAYHEPTKRLFVLDAYDKKMGIFDSGFKLVNSIATSNPASNYTSSFLAASDRYVYRLDDAGGVITVVDPAKTDVSPFGTAVVSVVPFTYGPAGQKTNISYFLVDSQKDKLYISSSPYPQVTVLNFSNIPQYSAKIISGNFPKPAAPLSLFDLVKKYWWLIAVVVLVIGFVIYYLVGRSKRTESLNPNF